MEKAVVWYIFGILSLLTGLLTPWYTVGFDRKKDQNERVLSRVQRATLGVFAAVVLIFIPVYYTDAEYFRDNVTYLRPLLLSLHTALRTFIMDGDFDTVTKALKNQDVADWYYVFYSFYAACLYVAAPVLTFGNVLSLFKSIRGEVRFWLNKDRDLFIFSELNTRSVMLAKSAHIQKPGATIVFTEVFAEDREEDYELLAEIKRLRAICLKKDIAHLDIYSKGGNVEVFLIGEDEGENVSQAVKLTKALDRKNTKQNVKIFVFSRNAASGYVIDSVRYDNLLAHAARHGYDDNSFKLRRVDEIRQLVWNTVPTMKVFDIAQRNNGTLSVLLAGMGAYGMEFFKMLVWYCQFEGYRLEINIVDKQTDGDDGKRSIESLIRRQCPELLSKNNCMDSGDAQYSIEIFPGVDMLSSDFADLLLYQGYNKYKLAWAERLQRTNLAIIALGDDDLNIEAAVHARALFDRVHSIVAGKNRKPEDELVKIYSVVYDEQKSGVLHSEGSQEADVGFLRNHKDIPYNISFIGGMPSQYSYKNIYDKELEEQAFYHHVSWVDIDEKIRKETTPEKPGMTEAQRKAQKENGRAGYEKYEYFRHSSMAKELYRRAVRENNDILKELTKCRETGHLQTCPCEGCQLRKRSEHMRWNAYTRVVGYIGTTKTRADRAKLHNLLVPWDQLAENEKLKD